MMQWLRVRRRRPQYRRRPREKGVGQRAVKPRLERKAMVSGHEGWVGTRFAKLGRMTRTGRLHGSNHAVDGKLVDYALTLVT